MRWRLRIVASAAVSFAATLAALVPAPASGGVPAMDTARAIPRDGIAMSGDGTVQRTIVTADTTRTAGPASSMPDPDLEPGFPVSTLEYGGGYHVGPIIGVTITDLGRDAELELCASALGAGPVSCWNPDGSPVPGWSWRRPPAGVGYLSAGGLEPLRRRAVVTTFGYELMATDVRNRVLDGWPVQVSNFASSPAALGDLTRHRSLAVVGEEDWQLHAYGADGTPLPGWPVDSREGGQERHTPAIANVDGERGAEIFTVSGWTSPGIYLYGIHLDGTKLAGYPILLPGEVDTYPVIGDVDGDGSLEVVVVGTDGAQPVLERVFVVDAATGVIEGSRLLSGGSPYVGTAALADLDGSCAADGLLDIVVQTEPTLEVVTWDGSRFRDRPGFPVIWSLTQWQGNSAPVVGDIDGLPGQEIVMTGQESGDGVNGTVYAFDASGSPLPRFPKALPIGSGGGPAIADVDLDGRNEIAIKGSAWDGHEGLLPTLWLYDLGGGPHGPVSWPQFMHDASHSGRSRASSCAPL